MGGDTHIWGVVEDIRFTEKKLKGKGVEISFLISLHGVQFGGGHDEGEGLFYWR